jgi:hypothetical protein
LKGGNFQYLVVFAGDVSLYGIDLKIKLEREIAKKIVLGKWSPIVNAKSWLFLVLDADA